MDSPLSGGFIKKLHPINPEQISESDIPDSESDVPESNTEQFSESDIEQISESVFQKEPQDVYNLSQISIRLVFGSPATS